VLRLHHAPHGKERAVFLESWLQGGNSASKPLSSPRPHLFRQIPRVVEMIPPSLLVCPLSRGEREFTSEGNLRVRERYREARGSAEAWPGRKTGTDQAPRSRDRGCGNSRRLPPGEARRLPHRTYSPFSATLTLHAPVSHRVHPYLPDRRPFSFAKHPQQI